MLSPKIIDFFDSQIKPASHVFLAFSGGVDSHVLLHLCAALPQVRAKLTAVHIHHGLQVEADAWPEHCRIIAEQLGVQYLALRVDARPEHRQSPEEAARIARYDALKALMHQDDVLLVAQHREDQLETVFLQLFRGAGLPGLSGMSKTAVLGEGVMIRPLLDMGKAEIEQYARFNHLQWIEDPSNQSSEFDRNFLRNQVIPLLKHHWPALDKTVSRSAYHCAEAQVIIQRESEALFAAVYDSADRTLLIARLRELEPAQQRLVIRCWFQQLSLTMPALAQVDRILQEIVRASGVNDPVLNYQAYTFRRYRNKLYCLLQQQPAFVEGEFNWANPQQALELPCGQVLKIEPAAQGIDFKTWCSATIKVKYRSGGEKIRLPGRQVAHTLKNVYQEAGIVPWERPKIPLIYLNGRLAVVADLWIDAGFYRTETENCIRLVWCK